MAREHALVTGASQGLGAYLAGRLSEEGWKVTGLGRRPESELAGTHSMTYLQADLSQPETLEMLPGRIGKTPDLIVHAAVAYPDHGGELSLRELERVFRVNALAPYRLTLDLLAAQSQERFCSCIVVNSEVIYHADAQSGAYAASKAALRVLTAALADGCRSRNASVATLQLGPLTDLKKVQQLRAIAAKRGASEEEVTRLFLRRSNPNLVIDQFIDLESCFQSVGYIAGLGAMANGMVCRLDGGSSGSLT